MKKISFLLFSCMVLFAISCRKEKQVSLSQHEKPNLSAVSSQTLLGQADLMQQMQPLVVSPYSFSSTAFKAGTNTTQVINTYTLSGTNSVMHVALADFGFLSQTEKNNFLSGAAFALAPSGFSTSFFQVANPSMGYQINQYTGDGAVAMTISARDGAVGLFSDNVSSSNGSFINASVINSNVPGWEIYDANSKVGFVILLVNNRFGIVVDGTNLVDIKTLKQVAGSFDFTALTAFGQ
jgi:hypothetical protein